MSTFSAWPKIPRWNREVVITEKIDGTNAAIIIEQPSPPEGVAHDPALLWHDRKYDQEAGVYRYTTVHAQSRSRLIYPGADNFGFAGWVQENAVALVNLLGPGRHFGEWYGKGIQRNYGLDHKRFALFNTHRWSNEDTLGSGLPIDVVPVLQVVPSPGELFPAYESEPTLIDMAVENLRRHGSALVPGFKKPEGVVLWHTAARQSFKILLEGDDVPKGQAA